MKKVYEQYKNPTIEKVLEWLMNSFSHLNGKEINNEVMVKITTFQNFIKTWLPFLREWRDIIWNVIESSD